MQSQAQNRKSLSCSLGKAHNIPIWDVNFTKRNRSSATQLIDALRFSKPFWIAHYWKLSFHQKDPVRVIQFIKLHTLSRRFLLSNMRCQRCGDRGELNRMPFLVTVSANMSPRVLRASSASRMVYA